MKRIILIAVVVAMICSIAAAGEWKSDPIWHDGLVEKATYTASRVIYGKPRPYTAIIFTNKEQHDRKTLTKSDRSTDTIEVFKHNHVEVVPTPNYDYKFETTSHLTVDKLELTRLDASSQEFCGTSFKQFLHQPGDSKIDYWSFSYMPESGRVTAKIDAAGRAIVPEDALPLWLRDYDFNSRQPARFWLLPSQKSNRPTPHQPAAAEVRYEGQDKLSHKLRVVIFAAAKGSEDPWTRPSQRLGYFWMDKDRQRVMTKYEGADGQKYELQKVERVNYWTIAGE
jgi:hypothetical protein